MHSRGLALGLLALGVCWGCPRLGPGDRGDSCTESADCESDLVCVDDKCGSPWGERWRLTVVRATFGPNDGNNDPWDGDGLPDPYVRLTVNGLEQLRTTTRADTRSPVWSESVSIPLQNDTLVEMVLREENLFLDQSVVTTGNKPASLADLRAGETTVFAVVGADTGNVNDRTVTLTYRWELE